MVNVTTEHIHTIAICTDMIKNMGRYVSINFILYFRQTFIIIIIIIIILNTLTELRLNLGRMYIGEIDKINPNSSG